MCSLGKRVAFVCVFALSSSMFAGCASSLSYSSTVNISPTSVLVVAGQTVQFIGAANVPNVHQFLWQVNGVVGGSPSSGTISLNGVYTAPATSAAAQFQIGIRGPLSQATVSIFDPSQPTQGSINATQNLLVAAYRISAPVGSTVQVQFGTDTTYGRSTSNAAAPPNGGAVTVLVAGMRANTTYHMQAICKPSSICRMGHRRPVSITRS